MGTSPSFKSTDWQEFKKTASIDTARNASDIFKSRKTDSSFLPYKITRECVYCDAHPKATPIIIDLDVTGSMERLLTSMAKELGKTMEEILTRKSVPDPEILFGATDDFLTSEEECLQVTQFEPDIKIAEEMTKLNFLERGGGNSFESYEMLWYFAARHTKCDAFKDGRKGFLFTIGDDGYPKTIKKEQVKEIFGDDIGEDIPVSVIIDELSKNWEIFHITMTNGGSYREGLKHNWTTLLGERALFVDSVENVSKVIVSTIDVLGGKDMDTIVKDWDNSTAIAVKNTLSGLVPAEKNSNDIVVF